MTELEKASEAWAQEKGVGASSSEPRCLNLLLAEEVAFEAGAQWLLEKLEYAKYEGAPPDEEDWIEMPFRIIRQWMGKK